MNKEVPIQKKLWDKIEKQPGGCWLWNGKLDRDGHGRVTYKGIARSTHSLVYQLIVGAVPVPPLQIDHLCRVRRCVNPDHMEAVTVALNLQRGETAKLTVENVRRIRAEHPGLGKGSVAWNTWFGEMFEVNPTTIRAVIGGKTWKNIK